MLITDRLDISFNKHGGNTESTAAHESIVSTKTDLRVRVLKLIRCAGERGATSDAVELVLGGRHQSISARFTELKAAGLIEPAGRRKTRSGRTAMAWRVTLAPGEEHFRFDPDGGDL